MTEDQALEWAGEGSAVTNTELEVVTHDLFCAVCDIPIDDAPQTCAGALHPSLFPHRWRVKTTIMLSYEEALDLHLGSGDPASVGLPQALNVYCDLCGEEFDPRLTRCSERAALRAEGSTISDEELRALLDDPGGSQSRQRHWEELRWIGHDSWLAIADAGISLEDYSKALDRLTIAGATVNGTSDGYPFVACFTQADDPVPIEVAEQAGEIEALRLCWTNDVDRVDGRWMAIGRMTVTSGRCRVWDPRHHNEADAFVLDIPRGFYETYVFLFEGDCLGMMIKREGWGS